MAKLIYIDAGHGKGLRGEKDPGAIGPTRLQEATVTHDMGPRLGNLLRAMGFRTMGNDRPGMPQRSYVEAVKLANAAKADIFISLHCNASTSSSAKGIETYFWRDGKNFANLVQSYLLEQLNDKDRIPNTPKRIWYNWMPAPIASLLDRKVKEHNFYVVRATNMPAILIELGFISNPGEEKLLRSNTFRQQAAQAVADAVKKYFGK